MKRAAEGTAAGLIHILDFLMLDGKFGQSLCHIIQKGHNYSGGYIFSDPPEGGMDLVTNG